MSEQHEDLLHFRFRKRYQSFHIERSRHPIATFDGSALAVIDRGLLKRNGHPDFYGLFTSILENAKRYFGPMISISDASITTQAALSLNRSFIAFTYDEYNIFICEVYSKLRVIDPVKTSMPLKHPKSITCIAWSPDSKLLASGSRDHTIRIWDVETGELQESVEIPSNTSYIGWSPDGSMFVCTSTMARAELDRCSVCNSDVRLGDDYCLNCGQRLYNNNSIIIWDTQTWQYSVRRISSGSDTITCVAWSPDSQMLAIGLSSYAIHVRRRDGRAERFFEGIPSKAIQISFSADNKLLAVMCEDASVSFWNMVTGKHGILTIPNAEVGNTNGDSELSKNLDIVSLSKG